ncbi:hypothetical protein AK812_SmicGene18660 [Symbiodinium microadriaticum]|uniref:Uncharacterized protein n=1 Tax=Symbiodinium microadriaticum TaxID=2951 RepID=A0A1Q9DUM5_SYMMI|nr:hypothetical protein AK812_SmicGene18660 [Symbiodinium microadriaticum]
MAQRTCACRGRFDLRARVSSPPFRASGCEGVPKSRARVARNVRLADMNIDVPISDDRRTEVVANALSLRHSAQQAVDATIVSRVTRAGEAQPVADVDPGRAVDGAARRKRHQSYPERLVVIGVEVGGRSGAEAATWLRRAIAASLLELPLAGEGNVTGEAPGLHEVLADVRWQLPVTGSRQGHRFNGQRTRLSGIPVPG